MASMPISYRVRCPSHTRCPRLSPGLCPLTILIIPLGSHHRTACLIKPAPVPRILRLDSYCDARIRTSPLPLHCLNPGIVLLPQLLRNQLAYNSWRPVLKRLVVKLKGSYTRVSESGRCLSLRRSHPAVLWRTVPLASLL